jgi:hypothetical protein
LNFEQMPGFGGGKAMRHHGLTASKPFVQTDFSVNKWFGGALAFRELQKRAAVLKQVIADGARP